MSWSVSAGGKPADVLKFINGRIEEQNCAEPEQTIKAHVGEAIKVALDAMPPDLTVNVNAYGSQSAQANGKFANSLTVQISYNG